MKTLSALSLAITLLWFGAALAAPLCTRFTIKESVPRTFEFKIQDGAEGQGGTFDLNCRSEFGDGQISCTRVAEGRADCRLGADMTGDVVVTLNLESTNPEDMGSIVTGFSTGQFHIGRGGWTLRCL
jgi:hypothetical protein